MSGVAAATAVLLLASLALADAPPWRARRRSPQPSLERFGTIIADGEWPAEPPSPSGNVDPTLFAAALRELCQGGPPDRMRLYAQLILDSAREFGEDPFLIGALVWREGRCHPNAEDDRGVGLTRIPRALYAGNWRSGTLHYQVRAAAGRWERRAREMRRWGFGGPALLRADANIWYAAGLLAMWREQHEGLDSAFEQERHRHYVSHWYWGDRVRNHRLEDRVLTDRRRLLLYYGAIEPMAPIQREGLTLGSPLDGAPRVITSGLGSERDGGDRRHRGIDLESLPGEPVRAIADGRVSFAGVDLPGTREHRNLRPDQFESIPRADLGRGGRYVCIGHSRSDGGSLTSCYMHLETVEVVAGQRVARGDRVGTVGRTGMQDSAAHLHLEIKTSRRIYDPAEVMRGLVIGRPQVD